MFASLVALLPLALFGALVNAQSDCARNYTVRLGDVCDSISAAQNVSTFQLANANPTINADCSNLALGEPLCLGITGQDCTTTHVVSSGETCTSIADGAGIAFSLLVGNNPNVNADCSNIYPGEVRFLLVLVLLLVLYGFGKEVLVEYFAEERCDAIMIVGVVHGVDRDCVQHDVERLKGRKWVSA
ncbi:uncharacterized protein STEHIDRAFT_61989 [Stereum hirsutum FP-91666 SS1]|uniref:uncharacterized protein n=1 Tax=Stereum hirsutum (strain FP-91666) TaxID=721885 RepID=UPI000444A0F9|nr:uncharacterized protein STEHIDRAFT_61989 [Stereum hirsutum FP-91666 SS1]EIM84046.1 hypothetical protein STEHIDRAFT_61989 [Stereum hirsutum FP-91666 SS1]